MAEALDSRTTEGAAESGSILDRGYAYWDRIRAGREMPSRADIEPTAIPDMLPYVILIDVLRDPLDFRFRLIGTGIDGIVARNYRGTKYSQWPHTAPGNPIWEEHVRVIEGRKPRRAVLNYVGPHQGKVNRVEHWLMPCSTDGKSVDLLMAVVAVDWKPGVPR